MPVEEAALDAGRPIIDAHTHLWEIMATPGSPQEPQRYLMPEWVAMVAASGHDITHTVFVEAWQNHRADGPAELRPVGETEFVNGIAAMSASGRYGPCRLAHRIVGNANLLLGAGVRHVLEAHLARAGERFRGIRMHTVYSDAPMFGMDCDQALRGIMLDTRFIAGAAVLAELDLSLDVWCVHTQLGEVAALADRLPDLAIVLNHIGTPESEGAWAGRVDEARADWASRITELARRPNVSIKLGGMGMGISGSIRAATGGATSQELAASWGPYVETAIAAFSPRRAMFESNFPPDKAAGSYGTVWNAFKRIAAGYSEEEKDDLFRRTAARVYRIALD